MSATGPALLVAAAGVGFGHAVLPDHWVPLAVLGRTRRYSLSRLARVSGLAGVAHVLVSIALGALIIAVGLPFRSAVQHIQDAIVGGVLIVTGVGFIALRRAGRGHSADHSHNADHDHRIAHEHHHDHHRGRGLVALVVPFGAAASPDLTILPVFLAATTAGLATAVGSLIVFAAVTVATIVGLTLAAARGAYRIHGDWIERWSNLLTGAVLGLIGLLILLGVI